VRGPGTLRIAKCVVWSHAPTVSVTYRGPGTHEDSEVRGVVTRTDRLRRGCGDYPTPGWRPSAIWGIPVVTLTIFFTHIWITRRLHQEISSWTFITKDLIKYMFYIFCNQSNHMIYASNNNEHVYVILIYSKHDSHSFNIYIYYCLVYHSYGKPFDEWFQNYLTDPKFVSHKYVNQFVHSCPANSEQSDHYWSSVVNTIVV
jgi:hypothetical protein